MIVGVDISSRRVDLSWLDQGKPQRWHVELGGPKTHLIDRVRACRIPWHDVLWDGEVTDIAIEYPFGRSRAGVAALMAVAGVVTHSAPTWARVAWPSAGELRAAIGAKNNKQAAHDALLEICAWNDHDTRLGWNAVADWNEHELDALVACIGWTRILAAQDAA